ncbi:cohesin domain-containing protein [Candidatus Soleaferrea massiliensis]|uniref:cohesin domain-containing protein n=1 Tax=Candidatus Soleaferrea massiliensis TaxID=1470354 RepID=UPI00058F7D70|nr:cohesin domain-containing protein [Candidatus Soleaferrea massiliensis]
MKKRIILRYALTLMLLLGIIAGGGFTALAAGEVTVQVSDVSVSPGQTVTTELVMDGTFAAFQGRLVYDTGALVLEKIEATSAISGNMTMFNQDSITGEFKDGIFAMASSSDKSVSGAVLTFTFRAGDNASGDYSFSVEQFKVYDEEGAELTVNAVDTIVDKGSLSSTTSKSTDSGSSNSESAASGSSGSESTDSGSATSGSSTSESTNSGSSKLESTTSGSSNSESTNSDPGQSGGNGLVILLIVSAVVVVGAVVTVFVVRARKKNNQTEDHQEDNQTEDTE